VYYTKIKKFDADQLQRKITVMNNLMATINAMQRNVKTTTRKLIDMGTALNKKLLDKLDQKDVQREQYLQRLKTLHGNHLLNCVHTICCSHFGHPHNSKLCERVYMSMEAIEAENDITENIKNQTQFLPNVQVDIDENNNGGTELNEEDDETGRTEIEQANIPEITTENSNSFNDDTNNSGKAVMNPNSFDINESSIPHKNSDDSTIQD
jgi:hypothetical protein